MARVGRKKYAVSKAASYGSSYDSAPDVPPFGPVMADWMFGVNNLDYEESYTDDSDDEYVDSSGYLSLPIEERWYQSEMELETVEEKAARLEAEIHRFKRAYKVMAFAALKWQYLQNDIEENQQIEKMFKDIQMMRKLSGSDNV